MLKWLTRASAHEEAPRVHSTADVPAETHGDQRFLSPWDFRIRFTEEVNRSTRYERALSFITMVVDEDERLSVDAWLGHSIRALDAMCRDIDNQYYLLLPETDAKSASGLAKRLLKNFRGISVTVTGIPADESGFRQVAESISTTSSRSVA